MRLLHVARHRNRNQAKLRFDEKMDCQLQPYRLVEAVPKIANWLFQKNRVNRKFCISSLRDRLNTTYVDFVFS